MLETALVLLYHFEEYNLPVAIVAIPGTVIGLLLAFRTNSCYGRWWEARILWGAIVNDSRTWVRQLIEFSRVGQEPIEQGADIHTMAYRQSAWCYALARTLRKQDRPSDTPMLSLSRTIEINIKQMLGETDLPERPTSTNGVLY